MKYLTKLIINFLVSLVFCFLFLGTILVSSKYFQLGDMLNSVKVFFLDTKQAAKIDTQTLADSDYSDRKEGTVDSIYLHYPKFGEQYGRINIPALNVTSPLYWGDSDEILAKGMGQYSGSKLLGEEGYALIGGHTIPYFLNVNNLVIGDTIQIDTTYGQYTFLIKKIKIAKNNDKEILDMLATQTSGIILYTCDRQEGISLTDKRHYLIAEKASGPSII
ncbi:class D sortase [Enterococcus mundtii]|uniref:class D sortase n=1 Tax=Enterococcus mundtii TaxID=53346 RepID=UPI000E0343D4|nr:class D sortase [Enterococcus mundtii]STE38077.1 peptidase, sortase like protein [Enterococcus mundtii]